MCTLFSNTRKFDWYLILGEEIQLVPRPSSCVKRTVTERSPCLGGGGSCGSFAYPSKSGQLMLLNSSRGPLKAGGELGSRLVYNRWEIISYSLQQPSPDSRSYEILGPRSQRDSNDISVCRGSKATRIPCGWMGQFRSRSEFKLIRELGEKVSIKETWIELCMSFQLSGFWWTCMLIS